MNVWQQVIDNELVTWGMVANDTDTYEEAKAKLNKLLYIIQELAVDPLVNGGYVLVPVEPTEHMLDAALFAIKGYVADEDMGTIYKAMIQAAQEEE